MNKIFMKIVVAVTLTVSALTFNGCSVTVNLDDNKTPASANSSQNDNQNGANTQNTVNQNNNDANQNMTYTPPPAAPAAQTPVANYSSDIYSLVSKKDQYHHEIASLADDINSYIGRNSSFYGADSLINRARSIRSRIVQSREDVFNSNYPDYSIKNTLVEVFDAELQRVDGLIEGMEASRAGGSYKPGFQHGSAGKKRFDSLNAELNRMLP